MKKIILSFLFVFCAIFAGMAQEDTEGIDASGLVSKKGLTILPEQGDIAIGISMNPIFNYLGNSFNGNLNNTAPTANFLGYPVTNNNLYISGQAPTTSQIFAKYFLTDKSAVRVSFEYTGVNTFNKVYVQDDATVLNDPLSNAKITDMQHITGSTFVLGAGYEMRRGSSRVQGYMGGNAYFLMQNSKIEYSYGNPMSELNPIPTSNDWGGNILANGGRKLVQYNGPTKGAGLGAILGVECFIFPKISIGAELGYGYFYYQQKQTKYDYEIWNVDVAEQKIETQSPGNKGHMWGTGNPSANFYMMFHF